MVGLLATTSTGYRPTVTKGDRLPKFLPWIHSAPSASVHRCNTLETMGLTGWRGCVSAPPRVPRPPPSSSSSSSSQAKPGCPRASTSASGSAMRENRRATDPRSRVRLPRERQTSTFKSLSPGPMGIPPEYVTSSRPHNPRQQRERFTASNGALPTSGPEVPVSSRLFHACLNMRHTGARCVLRRRGVVRTDPTDGAHPWANSTQ